MQILKDLIKKSINNNNRLQKKQTFVKGIL